MRKCAHCGRENDDGAARCAVCGAMFAASVPGSEVQGPWERMAVLAHAVEADRLDVELNNRQIPHVMVSYGDSALNGLFQAGHGWGHVEAPVMQRDAVLSILDDIRQESPEPEGDTPGSESA